MGDRRRVRVRVGAAAAVVALAGCVGPAAFSRLGGTVGPGTTAQPVAQAGGAVADTTAAPMWSSGSDAALASTASPVPTPAFGDWRAGEGLAGVDVSRYQEGVNWAGLVATDHWFTYVKATEGTSHRSPTHDEQRAAARQAGLVQGAYHYARPAQSSGTLQARFFNASGGAWAADGLTLPGALDLEFAEEGDRCHGVTSAEMVRWVREFSDEYRRLSGRIPVIYTRAEVWDACTGGDASFGDHPLWLFDHAGVPGALPTGWERPTLWQRAVENHLDRNVFFGTPEQLVAWAAAPLR